MKKLLLLLLPVIFLTACGSKKITEQQRSFADKKWQRSQNLTFEFTIKDTSLIYQMTTGVKYFDNFPFDRIQLSFVLEDPSGEKRTSEHDFYVRNKEGRFLGTRVKDTMEIEFPVRNYYKFKAPGKAKVTFVNQLPYISTEGIGGLSLTVKRK
jgi:gliding motility-associated lipoprotein GldH